MMTLQNIQMAAPVAYPHARASEPVETVAAVKSAEAGDRARNDLTQDAGSFAEREAERVKQERTADPSEPVGPPPSFAANVLEAERARFRDGDSVEAVQETQKTEAREAAEEKSAEAREDRAETREAPQATRSAYGGVREDAPRMLDVSR